MVSSTSFDMWPYLLLNYIRSHVHPETYRHFQLLKKLLSYGKNEVVLYSLSGHSKLYDFISSVESKWNILLIAVYHAVSP